MILTYPCGTCNTEHVRLKGVLDYHYGSGDISDREYRILKRNLDGGFYQFVRDRMNEILDGR